MIGFNLVPKGMRGRSRQVVDWLRVGVIAAVAATMFVLWGTYYNSGTASLYQQQLADLQGSLANVESLERQLREARRDNQALQREIDAVAALGEPGHGLAVARAFAALLSEVPQDVLITQISIGQGGAWTVAGIGGTPEDVSTYLARLQASAGVSGAELIQLIRPLPEDPSLRRFTLRVQLPEGDGTR